MLSYPTSCSDVWVDLGNKEVGVACLQTFLGIEAQEVSYTLSTYVCVCVLCVCVFSFVCVRTCVCGYVCVCVLSYILYYMEQCMNTLKTSDSIWYHLICKWILTNVYVSMYTFLIFFLLCYALYFLFPSNIYMYVCIWSTRIYCKHTRIYFNECLDIYCNG